MPHAEILVRKLWKRQTTKISDRLSLLPIKMTFPFPRPLDTIEWIPSLKRDWFWHGIVHQS